ncbi:hypothetical protein FOXG_22722 [Fusarium oxysporum f. sp. lycopersici 4287]|uniref:Uncharacterized protein n=1 Tax=Fusarium oxysporum f. sp. lycopersici (strain 4287 / CBS 123668 / FGSC 9935 / NRRL 34936) TaxID=426428 RepID=A0A0J9WVS1_FUSO4|nr:hypothetical protein FOXG_22722 [Fusarium oxysporum f. sp. lycopersici 4287]EWZ78919.1 hypothetical protein FOWG_16924 [Fusarium oxysporum f. sp. lycopersici MN25]KAJ9413720.1 hypothetical protein QL093DRAFT_2123107 [Fusarium oxysporum]KNB20022.1 hypothetical protein FOXG_22722 [Fusarium oxysporum f. sp. lycopersici 4287]
MENRYARRRRYWRNVWRAARDAHKSERTFCLWCELRKHLGRAEKAPVCKGVNLPQEVSEPTPWQEDHSIYLRHGGILRFSFQFYLKPGFESWYLPQGPSPTPQLMYGHLFEILRKELGLHYCYQFQSKNHEPLLVHCLNQPESSDDKPFAQEIQQKISSAVYDCMKRIQLEIVHRMIKRNCKRSEWVTKGDSPGCPVGHPGGDLYGTLPCEHVRCMHCEIELTMKADNGRKCGECEEPYDIIPFSTRLRSQFIPSQ